MNRNLFVIIGILFLFSCGQNSNKQGSADQPAAAGDSNVVNTAKEAYTFALPLALMDITRRKMMDASAGDAASPENVFAHKSSFPDASFRDVVRPNADTYYSTAFLNLKKEPLVLSLPNSHGRYYMMPILDAYTNVFVSPGTRTTGNGAGLFLISGPKWQGTVPAGMKQIKSPTNMAWIIGRTQVNSKMDGEKIVIPLQKKYLLVPLSSWGKPYTAPAAILDSTVPKGTPNDIVKNMPIDSFFNYCNRLMVDNPPAEADKPILEKLATIGVGPGLKFDMSKFDTAEQTSLKALPEQFFSQISGGFTKAQELVNGWNPMRGTFGTYGTEYLVRAMVSYGGLGANLREDAMYPSTSFDSSGNQLNGANKYVIHFNKGATPAANAFWSLTMYDPEGFMISNPINRNAIGDRSNLKKNADGSVDIYIQNQSPGKNMENNWLPAPAGDFNVLMRVYWPKPEMINGSWTAPPIKKIG